MYNELLFINWWSLETLQLVLCTSSSIFNGSDELICTISLFLLLEVCDFEGIKKMLVDVAVSLY